MSPQKSKPMHCFCTGFVYLCSGLIQKSYGKEPIKQVRLAGGNHL